MTALDGSATAALAPVREALLRHARRDAADVLAKADRDAHHVLARARADADALLADARVRGEADASAVHTAQWARSRREARTAELAVRRDAYERLRAGVIARIRRLRDRPDYPELRERLTGWARSALGEAAVITEAACGGVVGRTPDRYVDCSLDVVADRAVGLLGADVEGLWET